jgi:plastocyanin
MVNSRKADLLFAFLILFTLSLSIISYPISPSFIYGESDGDDGSNDDGGDDGSDGDDGSNDDGGDDGDDGDDGSNDDGGDDGDDGSNDGGDDGDDGSNDDGGDDGDDGDDGSNDDGGDDGDDGDDGSNDDGIDESSVQEDSLPVESEDDGSLAGSDNAADQGSEVETQSAQTEEETQSTPTEGETQSAQTEEETQSTQTEGETQSTQTEGESQSFLASILNTPEIQSSQTEEELALRDPLASILNTPEIQSSQTEEELALRDPLALILNTPKIQSSQTEEELALQDLQSLIINPVTEDPNCPPQLPGCSEIGLPPPPADDESFFCKDGIDNDGDGAIDDNDSDCTAPGPGICPLCAPGAPSLVGGNDRRNDDNNNKKDVSDEENRKTGLPQVEALELQGENKGKTYYVLIENGNNETKFVPDKVTLTDGFTVIWLNNDNSEDHQLIITSDTGNPLLNSLVQSNNFIKYKFESEGTYFYSDPENPQINGIITILANGESEEKISKPIQGVDQIISSLGVK